MSTKRFGCEAVGPWLPPVAGDIYSEGVCQEFFVILRLIWILDGADCFGGRSLTSEFMHIPQMRVEKISWHS